MPFRKRKRAVSDSTPLLDDQESDTLKRRKRKPKRPSESAVQPAEVPEYLSNLPTEFTGPSTSSIPPPSRKRKKSQISPTRSELKLDKAEYSAMDTDDESVSGQAFDSFSGSSENVASNVEIRSLFLLETETSLTNPGMADDNNFYINAVAGPSTATSSGTGQYVEQQQIPGCTRAKLEMRVENPNSCSTMNFNPVVDLFIPNPNHEREELHQHENPQKPNENIEPFHFVQDTISEYLNIGNLQLHDNVAENSQPNDQNCCDTNNPIRRNMGALDLTICHANPHQGIENGHLVGNLKYPNENEDQCVRNQNPTDQYDEGEQAHPDPNLVFVDQQVEQVNSSNPILVFLDQEVEQVNSDPNLVFFDQQEEQVNFDPNQVFLDQEVEQVNFDPNQAFLYQEIEQVNSDPNQVFFDQEVEQMNSDSNLAFLDQQEAQVNSDPNKVFLDQQEEQVNFDPNQACLYQEIEQVNSDPNQVFFDQEVEQMNSDPNQVFFDQEVQQMNSDSTLVLLDQQEEQVNLDPNQSCLYQEIDQVNSDPNQVFFDQEVEQMNSDSNLAFLDQQEEQVNSDPNKVFLDQHEEQVNFDPNQSCLYQEIEQVNSDPNQVFFDQEVQQMNSDSNLVFLHQQKEQVNFDPNQVFLDQEVEQVNSDRNQVFLDQEVEQVNSDPNQVFLDQEVEQVNSDPNQVIHDQEVEEVNSDPILVFLDQEVEQGNSDPNQVFLDQEVEQVNTDPNLVFLNQPVEQLNSNANLVFLNQQECSLDDPRSNPLSTASPSNFNEVPPLDDDLPHPIPINIVEQPSRVVFLKRAKTSVNLYGSIEIINRLILMYDNFEQNPDDFMQSSDKDFRFMATNDLMSELQKDSIKLDDDSERKVVKMLLRLLEDKNGEVQNLAVKCLGPLVNKVKEYQVETIVDSLCTNMISDKEQLRDISSIGLKTVISELPQAPGGLSSNICKKITKRLITAIEREDVSVQLEALDIVADLLARFGTVLAIFHGAILNALLPLLSSQRQAVRKRTISALSNLVLSCNNSLYAKLLDHLFEGLQAKTAGLQIHTYIQCVAAVCRQSGHRFGEQISRFVPIIMDFSKEDDDELREFCLQAFEGFVHRCPNETTEHVGRIIDLCLGYVKYDPNYNYEDDEEENDEDGSSSHRNDNQVDDDDEEEENDEYSDDDDMSWKVRRAAAKCLECIIMSRHEMLPEFYRTLSPALIKRFKEREENVKSDIFHAYIALLRQTRNSSSAVVLSMDPDSMEQETPVYLLQQQVHQIVRAVQPQMREKSAKTRQDCFYLLKELCAVVPGALTREMGDLIPGIQYSLGDKNSNSTNMKIDALSFIHCLVMSHAPGVFHSYIPVLLPAVVTAVGDSFYKITAEALTVLQELVRVIRPLPGTLDSHGRLKSSMALTCSGGSSSGSALGSSVNTGASVIQQTPLHLNPPMFDFVPYVPDIYRCTLARLRATDIDQEVKERAISAMGQIVCTLGDRLRDDLADCMPLFLDRLRNEITRLTAVKALIKIASSPLNIPLSIINDAIPILGLFLRKNQRALKLSTLLLLDALIQHYHGQLNVELMQYVTVELPALLDEGDLHIAQYTLSILKSITERFPAAIYPITKTLLPQAMLLVKSPLLQGTALSAMLELFAALAQSDIAGIRYESLLPMLLAPVRDEEALHKQAYYSLAKCVAAITVNDCDNALVVVDQFVRDMPAPKTDSQHIFGLLVIGEIGRKIDLKSVKKLEKDIVESFSHISEEVKSAASYALGSIAIGNLNAYLTFVLREIANQPKRQYLLLHSLKEVISCLSSDERLHPFLPEIWVQLFKHAESPEEGTRNVVAECLGKLTLIKPHLLLPGLQENLSSPSPLMRTTCVTAVKFTISDQPSPIDPLLRQCIGQFLYTLQDEDLNVRRVALVAFNSAAHNKPSLIRDLLDGILPQLYSETVIKRDLIREVEMGPFTHTVDDGLDLRKAAFECMYTLLDSCVDRIDIFEFLNHVESGLRDHYDIKMLTYLMVARLSQICPGAVLQRLDRLVEPLRTTCTSKVKANSVKQEYEKQDELKRSAMRAVIALLAIPDADKNPQLSEFLNYIRNSLDLQPVFEAIQRDSTAVATHHDSFLMDQS